MKCTSPLSITSKEFTGNKLVPCYYCKACRINRVTQWTIRLLAELSDSQKGLFVTLTYNNTNLPINGTLSKRHLQLFFKKLRKRGHSIKYFAAGEYGPTTGRPHYHLIILGNVKKEDIEHQWVNGHVHTGLITSASIRYTVGYILEKTKTHVEYKKENLEPPFQLSSKNLGKNWFETPEEYEKLVSNGYFEYKGKKISIPKFLKDKYNEIKKAPDKRLGEVLNEIGFNRTWKQWLKEQETQNKQRALNLKHRAERKPRSKL